MAAEYSAPIVPNDIQTPGWNWNPSTAYLNAIQQGQDEAARTATAARQYQLLPVELAYSQARAKYYDARADKYEKDTNTAAPTLDLSGLSGDSSNVIDQISPDLLKQMGFRSSDNSTSDDTDKIVSQDSNAPKTAPTNREIDENVTSGGVGQNPPSDILPAPKTSQSNLTPQDLIHLGIDPNTPLGAIITAPGAPSAGDALATISQGLPITPENLGSNSSARLADNTISSSGNMPTATSDVGISPIQSAQRAAANSVPDRLQANNPLIDFAHGSEQVPKTLGLGADQIISGSKGVLNIDDALKSKSTTAPNNDDSVGNKISAYDTAMNQLALKATMLKQDSLRYGALARATSPKDPNRIPLLQKAFNASADSDKYTNTGQILAQHMTQETGIAPQNIEYLRTLKDPNKINSIHSYVESGKAPDYASAAQLFTAERNSANKQIDPAAKQALFTKTLGDIKIVTDLKNSGNVDGDTWSSLDAQEKALTAQANQLAGVQISQSPQYVDPLDKFNGINTKLSVLNASGVKSTDIDLGGGTKLTGIATDPNKASVIIRPEIMNEAANNNALYDIPHIQDQTATPEIQRFIQNYNQAPAGKNYVITGLPGMIRKDPAISAQQVLAAHFGAYTDKSKQKGAPVITTDSSTNPLVKEFSPENPHAEAALASLKQGVAPSPKDMSGTPYTAANLKAVSDQLAAAQSELEASKGNDWSKLPGTLPNIWSQTFGNGEVGLARAYEAAKQKVATLAAQKAEIESRLGTQKQ